MPAGLWQYLLSVTAPSDFPKQAPRIILCQMRSQLDMSTLSTCAASGIPKIAGRGARHLVRCPNVTSAISIPTARRRLSY